MISRYTSDELRLVLIDTTGVELNSYKDSNYRLLTAMNDLDKAQEVLVKMIEEVDRRKGKCLNCGREVQKEKVKHIK